MSSKEYTKSYAVKRNKQIHLITGKVFYSEDKSYVKIKRKELICKLDNNNAMCSSMYGQSSTLKLECHLN